MGDPATKARACFALAESTTFDGERAAAIGRGLKILEKAGLDPDRFDIPGRARRSALADRPAAIFEVIARARATEQFYKQHRARAEVLARTAREHQAAYSQAEAKFKERLKTVCAHGVPGFYECEDCNLDWAVGTSGA